MHVAGLGIKCMKRRNSRTSSNPNIYPSIRKPKRKLKMYKNEKKYIYKYITCVYEPLSSQVVKNPR